VDQFKTNVAQAFGEALRLARKDSKLSQEALALESGIDRTFVSMLERGIRQPALSTVFALCVPLGISPGTLVDRAHKLNKGKAKK
jgi:transcriptional regulator with XRE-family HTH domain